MNIILIGPQASGKGTQAERLHKHFQIPHLSTGDMLRHEIHEHTSLGQTVHDLTEKGELVPDTIVEELVKKRLAQNDCAEGFILEGFPRDKEQAVWLESQTAIDHVILLRIPDDVAIERISSRRECSQCQATYGIHKSPKKEGVCDVCGRALVQREDDHPDAVVHRLEIYHQQTQPLLDHYKEQNKLITVDGTQAIDTIFDHIVTALESGNT